MVKFGDQLHSLIESGIFLKYSLKELKGDSASSCLQASLILFPMISDEETLREPPTPTTVHVRSILDLTNRPAHPTSSTFLQPIFVLLEY